MTHRQTDILVRILAVAGVVATLVAIAWFTSGCRQCANSPGLDSAGGSLVTGQHLADVGRETTERIRPHASAVGQSLVDTVVGLWGRTKTAMTDAESGVAQARNDYNAARAAQAKAEASEAAIRAGWGYRLQSFVHTWWVRLKWLAGSLFVLLIVLRLVSDRVGGAVGTAAWLALKGLLALITGGISLAYDACHAFADKMVDLIASKWSTPAGAASASTTGAE